MKSCQNCADTNGCIAKEVLHADAHHCASWKEKKHIDFQIDMMCMEKEIISETKKFALVHNINFNEHIENMIINAVRETVKMLRS